MLKIIIFYFFLITCSLKAQPYLTGTVQISNPSPCTSCCNGSVSISIISNLCPGAPVSVGIMSSSTGTLIQWGSGYLYNLCNGNYTVVVNGIPTPPCDAILVCNVSYLTPTKIVENSDEEYSNLLLFPNPTNGLLNISFDTESSFEKVQIVNSVGQLLMEKDLDFKNETPSINTVDLPNGLYLLKLFNSDESNFVYKKFIIRK